MRRRIPVFLALGLLAGLLAAALFAPWIAPHDPNLVILDLKLQPPSAEHWLGTDHLGRDILSRLLHGTRVSLGTVSMIAALVLALGAGLGSLAGYAGGVIDAALMRLADVFLTFPTFILAMFLVGVLGGGLTNVVLAITLTHWAWYARLVRGLVLEQCTRGYVLAARVSGTPRLTLVVRHILPPVLAQVAILATLDIGHFMLHVSGLSFLGLGIAPPTPEWGVMLGDAREYVWTQPMLLVWPGMMIFLSVMAFNLLGDALRDALDPAIRAGEG